MTDPSDERIGELLDRSRQAVNNAHRWLRLKQTAEQAGDADLAERSDDRFWRAIYLSEELSSKARALVERADKAEAEREARELLEDLDAVDGEIRA